MPYNDNMKEKQVKIKCSLVGYNDDDDNDRVATQNTCFFLIRFISDFETTTG